MVAAFAPSLAQLLSSDRGGLVHNLLQDIGFWIVAGVATIIKLLTSPFHSLPRSVAMVASGVLVAVLGTWPVLQWFRLNPDTFLLPVCALLTLTGEGVVRFVISVSMDPDRFFKLWRGKGGSGGEKK